MNRLLAGGGERQRLPASAATLLFLPPALGPALGGLLVPLAGWPAIFLVNVPIGLLGCLATLRVPPSSGDRGDPRARFDPLGLLLLVGGTAAALYGTAEGPQRGWTAPAVWPFWAAGALLLGLYVGWARRRPAPVVDLRLLRRAQAALAVGLAALTPVVLFAVVFLLPIFLQTVQGLSPVEAGLTLLPQGLVMGWGTSLGHRVVARRGLRATVVLGSGILALSTATLLMVEAGTPAWLTALVLSGRGLALGLTTRPLLDALLADLVPEEIPDANTLFNVTQRLASSTGIALIATFFAVRERLRIDEAVQGLGLPAHQIADPANGPVLLPGGVGDQLAQAAVAGFHDTVWVLALLCILDMGAALLLRDHPAQGGRAPSGASRPGTSTPTVSHS